MAPHPQRLTVTHRAWPLARPFAAARGVTTSAGTVVVEIADGDSRGRGESVPLHRFGETMASVVAAIEAMKAAVVSGLDRETLQNAMPPGAARNALDCAFWDIDCKRAYTSATELAGLPAATPVATAFAIGLDTPENMAALAAAHRAHPILKLHLGSDAAAACVQAVRQAAPASRLIVDASESWTPAQYKDLLQALRDCRVELIQQPLPAGADDALAEGPHPIPLCAGESCRTRADLDALAGKYETIEIGLDKAGGLTEAFALATDAKKRGFRIALGGAIGTSLGIAPALTIARLADIVVLDGPLHLASDRVPGLRYDGNTIHPPEGRFWGQPT